MKPKDYNGIDWNQIFEYSEESPSGLVWKIGRVFNGTLNNARIGQMAGSLSATKNREYWVVGIGENSKSKTYVIHRIIWVMKNGFVNQDCDVDHIDGNGLNNKIENLREVTKSINSRNAKMRKDNSSGSVGISFAKTSKSEGWKCVVIDLEGKKHTKYYSLLKYGDKAKQLAIQWRQLKMNELDFAGYTENHGKEKD